MNGSEYLVERMQHFGHDISDGFFIVHHLYNLTFMHLSQSQNSLFRFNIFDITLMFLSIPNVITLPALLDD